LISLENLYLDSNQISFIEPFAFVYLNKLVSLDLSKNKIKILFAHSLYGLFNVRSLSVSFNKIASIEKDSFTCLKNLENLRIESNQLKKFSTNMISSLKLKQVCLFDNFLEEDLEKSLCKEETNTCAYKILESCYDELDDEYNI
jgi:Leucine-rich repeat (LRR) protein